MATNLNGRLVSIAAALLFAVCGFKGAAAGGYTIDDKPVTDAEYQAYMMARDGTSLVNSDKLAEGIVKLKEALRLDPNLAGARCNYGFALFRQGKYDDAIAVLRSLKDDADSAAGWATLGGSYQSLGKFAEAIDAYKHYIKLAPNDSEVPKFTNLILMLSKQAAGTPSRSDTENYASVAAPDGIKWPASAMPLKVFIPQSSTAGGFKPQYARLLQQAFQDWSTASGGSLQFVFVDRSDSATITCDFTDNPERLISLGEGGHAQVKFQGKDIISGEVMILTKPAFKDVPLTDVMIQKTTLHEVGHALGMIGHSTGRGDIMFYSIDVSDQPGVISPRDIATVRALYPLSGAR